MDRKTPWLAALLGALGLAVSALVQPACENITPPTPGTVATPGVALDCGDAGGWPMYGGNVCNTRSAQTADDAGAGAITPSNAGQLAVKWKLDMAGDVSATPAVVAGQVFVPDWGGMLSRIDGATGKAVWSRSVSDILGDLAQTDAGASDAGDGVIFGGDPTSGLIARGTPAVGGGRVFFGVGTLAPILAAVDKDTGALIWKTSLDSHPNAIVTSSPALDNGRLYVGVSSTEEFAASNVKGYACCTFRGSVAAVDAATGKVVWQTPTIDDATYRNAADGTLTGYAGGAVWSGTPAIDHKRNLVYVTTGNNYATAPGVDGGAAPGTDGGAPLPDGDRIESIVALDLATGAVRWSQRMTAGDIWTLNAFGGKDFDFGDGAHLYQATVGGSVHDFVGAGQKSGVYWALDPDTGTVLWKTQVGPGGHLGGIQWGTAVDGTRVYVGVNDETGGAYLMGASSDGGKPVNVGSWAALDSASGATLWQIADPAMSAPLKGVSVNGPVSVVNGVLFAGSMDADGTMFAFDASNGKVLWSFKSGASVYGGAAVADGVVYWGNGYPAARLFFGTPGHTLYAFAVGK